MIKSNLKKKFEEFCKSKKYDRNEKQIEIVNYLEKFLNSSGLSDKHWIRAHSLYSKILRKQKKAVIILLKKKLLPLIP